MVYLHFDFLRNCSNSGVVDMALERDIKREIVAYLDSLGDRCWHVAYFGGGYGRNGVPDRLCCYRGRFFAIEVKRDAKHKPTKWQEREIRAIIGAGGEAKVVWSVEQVREKIEEIDLLIQFPDNDTECTRVL